MSAMPDNGLRASDSDENHYNEKYDGHRESTTSVGGRRMSRIGPVTVGPVMGVDVDSVRTPKTA